MLLVQQLRQVLPWKKRARGKQGTLRRLPRRRREGFVFLPFATETLGGLHTGVFTQVQQLPAAMARYEGSEEGEVTSQLFGRFSLTLMRGNALMLSTRCQDTDFPLPEVDGVK